MLLFSPPAFPTSNITPVQQQKSLAPVWYVVFAVLLWSTGGLFIKLTSLDAYQVTFFRSFLAAFTVLIATRKSGLRIGLFGLGCSVILVTVGDVWARVAAHSHA